MASGSVTLDGTVAVVTGAGGGLGRAHALELAARGALVVVNDAGVSVDGSLTGRSDAADAVVAEIRAAGGTAVADTHSVATTEGAAGVVDAAVERFGRIDALVNNAGFLRDATFAKLTEDMVRSVLDVHLLGVFWTSREAWRHMVEQRHGRIICTTSVAGLCGNFGQANYAAAKAGIVGLVQTLAIEGARYGITVNAISPAARTRMTEQILGARAERLEPSLVSPLVAVLASQECEATGEVFSVGAGRVARVVIGEGPGYSASSLRAEDLADRWNDVMASAPMTRTPTVESVFDLMFAGADG